MLIHISILLHLLITVISKPSINILYSQETEQELIAQIYNDLTTLYNSKIDLFLNLIDEKSEIGTNYNTPTIVIDITKNLFLKEKIKNSAKIFKFVYITIYEQSEELYEWEFFSHMPISDRAQSMIALLSHLNWNKIGVIYSDSSDNFNFRKYFEEKLLLEGNIEFFSIEFGNWLSQDLADNLVLREIKSKGLNNILVFNEGEGAEKLMQSFLLKNMYKDGFGIIFDGKAIWGPNNDGSIFLSEEGTENAMSMSHYHSLSIINLLNSIDIETESIYTIKHQLKNSTINRFSIVNFQEKIKKIVGSIGTNTVTFTDKIIFPGNSLIIPKSIKPSITLSIASGDTNFNGHYIYYNSYYKLGSFFAIAYAKYVHFLDNFDLNLYETDCSSDYYGHDFSYNCLLKQKSSLGLAFLPSYNDNVCYGTIKDFRELGLKIPLISDQCTSEIFTNKTEYPEFVRIMKSYAFHSNTLAHLMSILNWKCAIVFYENSEFGLDMYKSFSNIAKMLGIEIVNDEDKRMLDPLYAPDLYKNYTNYIKNAINTQCKITIPLMQPTAMFNLFGQLYDEGIRPGDLIYLTYLPIGFFQFSQAISNKTISNIKELLNGSIALWQSEWVGNYGQSLIDIGRKWNKNYGDGGLCPSFDAVMLGLNGVKYLIDAGEDYENPELLNEGIRKVKFTGCSGTVQISSNSNEKSTAIIMILNQLYNVTLGYYENIYIGNHVVGGNPPFSFVKNITWPDKTFNTPGDRRLNPGNCPFNLHLIQDSDAGYTLYYGFIFATAFIVVFLSFIILIKVYWKVQLPMMTEKSQITANDYIMMTMILVDFFQYLAMGPDIREFNSMVSSLYDFASANLSNLINFKGSPYWIAMITVFSICYLWLFLSTFIYFKLDKWKKIEIFDNIGSFARFITPIIGNLGFIPISHLLLTIFQCEKGIGKNLNESFMNHDCSIFCYKNSHIFFVILSVITLLIYLPLSILSRPLWQNLNSNANIYSNPPFLVAKSIFQIIAVLINKTLKSFNQSLGGCIYLVFVIIFIFYTKYRKPYNYHRCNLWTIISLLSLAWSLILSLIYYSVDFLKDYKFWIILQFGGWAILILIGLIIQWKTFPSLLYSEKGVDISIFFKFALTKQVALGEVIKKRSNAYKVYEEEERDLFGINSKNELIDSRIVMNI